MRRSAVVASFAAAALFLAGCGSDDSGSADSTSAAVTASGSGASGSDSAGSDAAGSDAAGSDTAGSDAAVTGTEGSASSEAPVPGPEMPGATVVAKPVAEEQMPVASGEFGDKPEFTWPEGNPPNSLQRQVISEGDGAEVQSGDYLVGNYEGIVWGSDKPFDNSYERGAPTTFKIGQGAVVNGWDVGLVGVKIGSRVLLSLPPADGYGANGNPGAGIKGTDTIVFVVDVVDAIGKDQGGEADAKKVKLPDTAPKVTGELGEKPTVEIGKAEEPTKAEMLPISEGSGDKVAKGDALLVQFDVNAWTGEEPQSTWPTGDEAADAQAGPQEIQVSEQQAVFLPLEGVTVGSRVLLLIPATEASAQGQGSPALAVVVDIVAKK